MTDLWTEASRDLESEGRQHALEMAKHASSGIWGFLAQAQSPVEYADRLDLAQNQIAAVASSTGAPLEDILAVFEQRFALLHEADKNPFGDDDSDKDDSDDDGDGNDDDDGANADKGDETDSGGDTDDSDDSDTNDDDDDDSDDDGDDDSDDKGDKGDKDQDDPGVSDDGSDGSAPFPPFKSSARYANLLSRIESGENPMSWGGSAPFVSSPSRKTAAGAIDDTVSDSNVPQDTGMDEGPSAGMGMPAALPETTKPRQLPAGGTEGLDTGGGEPLDPALNGGDIGAGADSPPDTQREAALSLIVKEVQRYNPGLSNQQCAKVAFQVMSRYLSKQAEDLSPLLYGDRGAVPDGPVTDAVKKWQPPDPKVPGAPKGGGTGTEAPGGGGGMPGGPKALMGGGEAAGAAGAGEAAGAATMGAEVAELAPLLLL
jgi:hypothetical protein